MLEDILGATPPADPSPRIVDLGAGMHSEIHMMDVLYLGLTLVLFSLTWGLVRLFERVA